MKDIQCPTCQSKHIVKRGKRKQRFRVIQTYQCKECGRRFEDKILPYKMYPARVIYTAINHYNLGYTLEETSRTVNRMFKVKTSKSSVRSWIHEFRHLCPIASLRKNFLSYNNVLFNKQFEHENLNYEFMYHRYKLDTFVGKLYPKLCSYITRFKEGCPDEFFEIGERCSQPKFEAQIKPRRRVNLACEMTKFAVKAAKDNRERHELVERFMLINDTATIACEIPVWYWEKSIDNGITGHIDILQLRNDRVYILDYKPGAAKDKKAPWQLYHYAVALSFRAKIPLKNIRCAWFDKDSYYEYAPSQADVQLIKK